MAYPYICKACREDRHADCEESRDVPPPPAIGGGVCICLHHAERTAFELHILNTQEPK